mmetsp:Transcript_5061/g.17897  ORF Transcript_5061/g.17897 Transcript_5061/m.17897 type:complete len:98 (-) Transcript_5061:1177-1470(-)
MKTKIKATKTGVNQTNVAPLEWNHPNVPLECSSHEQYHRTPGGFLKTVRIQFKVVNPIVLKEGNVRARAAIFLKASYVGEHSHHGMCCILRFDSINQ